MFQKDDFDMIIDKFDYDDYVSLKDLEFEKRNPWKKLRNELNFKASDFVKAKALAFWLNGIKIIKKDGWKVIAKVLPVKGYNKTFHEVIINPYSPIQKYYCWKVRGDYRRECQALRVYGVCSHVLAVLYKLNNHCGFSGDYYKIIRSKALEFLKKWRGEVDERDVPKRV